MKILVLNGPNLNMTGTRETGVYGQDTLESINRELACYCAEQGIGCDFFQSNSEGTLIDKIHQTLNAYDGCVFNAGAYTHYSYAIRDAIACVQATTPFVEVHLSDIHAREAFRSVSVIRDVCIAQICGFGKNSYYKGIDVLLKR